MSHRLASATTEVILLASGTERLSVRLGPHLRAAGYDVVNVTRPVEMLALTAVAHPVLAVVDQELPGATELVRILRADPRCGRPVILVTTSPGQGDERTGVLDPESPDAVGRVIELARETQELRAASPLTGLPGNVAIRAELHRRLQVGVPTTLLYCDLDGFKAYNDRYGFLRGDQVLQAVADLLVDEADDLPGAFVGHVGGDDFVVLIDPDHAEPFATAVIERFDALAPSWYDPGDARRGALPGEDRRGRRVLWPIVGLSIGAASTRAREVRDPLELVDLATEMKRVAKRRSGSAYCEDRRTDPVSPPPAWRLLAERVRALPAAALLVVALLVLLPVGTAQALTAGPDSPWWPARQTWEEVRLLAARNAGADAALHLEFANHRLAILARSAGDDTRLAATAVLAEQFREHVAAAMTLLDTLDADPRGAALRELAETQRTLAAGLVEARCADRQTAACSALAALHPGGTGGPGALGGASSTEPGAFGDPGRAGTGGQGSPAAPRPGGRGPDGGMPPERGGSDTPGTRGGPDAPPGAGGAGPQGPPTAPPRPDAPGGGQPEEPGNPEPGGNADSPGASGGQATPPAPGGPSDDDEAGGEEPADSGTQGGEADPGGGDEDAGAGGAPEPEPGPAGGSGGSGGGGSGGGGSGAPGGGNPDPPGRP